MGEVVNEVSDEAWVRKPQMMRYVFVGTTVDSSNEEPKNPERDITPLEALLSRYTALDISAFSDRNAAEGAAKKLLEAKKDAVVIVMGRNGNMHVVDDLGVHDLGEGKGAVIAAIEARKNAMFARQTIPVIEAPMQHVVHAHARAEVKCNRDKEMKKREKLARKLEGRKK